MAADGSKVETRDESDALPGYTDSDSADGTETAPDTGAPDTDTPDTDTPADPDTGAPDESGKAPATPAVVWRYSTRLKVMILATGAVVGLSLYAAIVVPFFVKKKRASR
jgi:hypothetical protein